MRMMKQDETSKAYPRILRVGITVYPGKQANGKDERKKY